MKKITQEWINKAEKDYLVVIGELRVTLVGGDNIVFVWFEV
jgi:hypothetical protein